MNVFILCAGRCGSNTIIAACRHVRNYTAGHETRRPLTGSERLAYPSHHIEADNRLSHFLGRLDSTYGSDAYYVHLTRQREAHAHSFTKNMTGRGSISRAWRDSVLLGCQATDLEACLDYVDATNENIRLFLQNKPLTMQMQLETLSQDFPQFWQWIGAEGDLDAAVRALSIRHNATPHGWRLHARNLREYIRSTFGL